MFLWAAHKLSNTNQKPNEDHEVAETIIQKTAIASTSVAHLLEDGDRMAESSCDDDGARRGAGFRGSIAGPGPNQNFLKQPKHRKDSAENNLHRRRG